MSARADIGAGPGFHWYGGRMYKNEANGQSVEGSSDVNLPCELTQCFQVLEHQLRLFRSNANGFVLLDIKDKLRGLADASSADAGSLARWHKLSP